MNKEAYERVLMLKKKAAEELHAMWDDQLKGGKEEVILALGPVCETHG